MAMTRFDPFRDLAVLQERMNRLFTDSLQGRSQDEGLVNRGSWTPAVDIYEIDGALVLKAELPDLRREDIDVNVENNTLTLHGERRFDEQVKQEQFHRIERAYGSFVRQFSLPSTVDSTRIAAEYKNGVLTITLPVREEAKPRSVKIEVAA
jgi:HSP20 family protein